MKWFVTILLSVISAVLYRAGGMSKDPGTKPEWIPTWMRQSWVRDWLIPLLSLGTFLIWWEINWSMWWLLLICYPLMGASFSTYWDWLFGKDNFYAHGFFIGLSTLPLIWAGVAWWVPLSQAVVMGLAMGLWCKVFGNDVVEEMFRGFISTFGRII